MSDKFDYDLFVIGGGSGGVRAARIAAQHGARVAVAEEYRYGGTCVIRGCVPKKLFVFASRFPGDFAASEGYGWSREAATFNWQTLLENKDREIGRLEGLYKKNLANSGVETFDSRAELTGPNSVRLIQADREVTADKILIATGGRPSLDDTLTGIEHTITSDEAFHLTELPDEIVIAGGGYISIEFAGIFAGLGVKTTIIYRGEQILRGFDGDMRKAVSDAYEARGIEIICNDIFTDITRDPDGGGLTATLRSGRKLQAGQIMMAIDVWLTANGH
ncbi:MAG: FAD-dependent oxidoreductase, partial [Pseudomonadota bacterium]